MLSASHISTVLRKPTAECETIFDLERKNLGVSSSTKRNSSMQLTQTIRSVSHNSSDLKANKDHFIFDRYQKSSNLNVNTAVIACQ